ncbi:MAG: hypothetical protein KDD15_07750, partial [Lewinella sp.]|nr:hypothetical protein [Lewinella sp.]
VDAQKVISFNGENVAMMWCGDANGDGYIRARETIIFTPAPELITSDRDAILNDGLIGEIGGQLQGYYNWDTNLDGYVRAREAIIFTPLPVLIPSDRDVILNTSLEGDVNGQHKVQY